LRFERFNISSSSAQSVYMGVKATTAPDPLKVLLLPEQQIPHTCSKPSSSSSSSSSSVVVVAVDCSQLGWQQQAQLLKDSARMQQQQQQRGAAAAAAAEAAMRAGGLWQRPKEAPHAPTETLSFLISCLNSMQQCCCSKSTDELLCKCSLPICTAHDEALDASRRHCGLKNSRQCGHAGSMFIFQERL
jgi:hypothetical protein